MSPLLAVALLCAADTPIEACTRATALDVIVRPVSMPTECAGAQMSVAATGLAHGQYLRISCERRSLVAHR